MKITLVHLFLKRIFEVSSRRESRETKYFIRRGEHFSSSDLKPHEKMFQNTYLHCEEKGVKKDPEANGYPVRIIGGLMNLLGAVEGEGFSEKITHSLVERGYLTEKRRLLPPPFNKKFRVTEAGKTARARLQTMIQTGDQHLKQWLDNRQPKALKFVQTHGANVFLLNTLDAQTLIQVAELPIADDDQTMPLPPTAALAYQDLVNFISVNSSSLHVLEALDGGLGLDSIGDASAALSVDAPGG